MVGTVFDALRSRYLRTLFFEQCTMGPTWIRQRLRDACKHAGRWGQARQIDPQALTGEVDYALAA